MIERPLLNWMPWAPALPLAELQPDNWTALSKLAAMYQFAHDYPHAQAAIVRALTMPDPAPVVTNLGTVGVGLGDTAQAWRAIRAMATRFATNPYATLQRVRLLTALGQRDSAASLATVVLRSGKSDPASRASAARTHAGRVRVDGGPPGGRAPDVRGLLAHAGRTRRDGGTARGRALKFAELWKRADPEMQPKVAEVQRRIAGLTDARAR
jgi:hypothetical protein